MTRDEDGLLAGEYREVAARFDRLSAELAEVTAERNAVVRAMADAGMTQATIMDLTGLTITQVRTALWNEWRTTHA